MFVVALHVVLCLFLILIIILQPGKGGDVAAAFGGGGGASTVFGPRGPTGLLQRATTIVAVLFMGTSITLALYSSRSVMQDTSVDDAMDLLERQGGDEDPQIEETPDEP
jgi:preprotein translocase subunit SecG